jgi:signal peptidase I
VVRYMAGGIILAITFFASPLYFVESHHLLPVANRNWVETFQIYGASMAPSLQENDRVFCHKGRPFDRWSIVVYETPEGLGGKRVQRVAGLPGETVTVINGQVHVDGRPVDPPAGVSYVAPPRWGMARPLGWENNPILLAGDEFFLLGDNGSTALDSRFTGPVPASAIEGPVTAIYWPPSRWRRLE